MPSPRNEVEAAAQAIGNAMITRRSAREIARAAWPIIAAAERTRIAAAAEAAAFTLFRPGNGPGIGQSMRVVPLDALLALLGQDGPG